MRVALDCSESERHEQSHIRTALPVTVLHLALGTILATMITVGVATPRSSEFRQDGRDDSRDVHHEYASGVCPRRFTLLPCRQAVPGSGGASTRELHARRNFR